ncbi:MAG TPA: Rieske 2Fe-2S domain-containing protein [Polyangiaceae bacterium LLY-WYZ-15_(1-7)]|nr:hypothetical protein [Sandaracinus sp.]HJK90157.1 Rieske 2Fe-2S domain-containing protein [Polyangiaceae bacterium LLY-WYZ-15_(1-7)]MBJ71587.1 hypothetical protein [Sandaracinus sp.]HJL00555.1 Rieske 2Fe-2S domain-containing protein [Polyangiaceae bacterium LLY-WYZ-15_(1-7)]HJL06897.1 Rieske 2Fe-2S domain-containing protein [Polyangiaceae bacterium LLY-WYZ-15_(1-7)]
MPSPAAPAATFEAELAEKRRLATYPDVGFPRSWYAAARTRDLDRRARRGQALGVEMLGTRLALFRDADGTARAVDATCPHLGADLADGRVKDGCLECPFHHWRFAPDGALASVPYLDADRLPKIRARSWPTDEQDGFVFVWYGGEGARGAEPEHALPPIDPALRPRGWHDAGVVRMNLREFAENSVDFAHFPELHGDMRVPWVGWKIPGLRIDHTATWEKDEARPWLATFADDAVLRFRGKLLDWSAAAARIRFLGPGGVVRFHFDLPKLGEIVLYQTHTPLAPLALRVRFRWLAAPRIPRLLVSYVVGNWISQWREDVRVWEGKSWRERPALVRGDGPIHALRRWYAQFEGPRP